jgi:pyruvate, water dikinase
LNSPSTSSTRTATGSTFSSAGRFRSNGRSGHETPEDIEEEDILLRTAGPILGEAVARKIDRILYIDPAKYSALPTADRYSLARLIGDIINDSPQGKNTMLIGPGRWGSTMPEMGVPVSFNDIRNVSVLCELARHA